MTKLHRIIPAAALLAVFQARAGTTNAPPVVRAPIVAPQPPPAPPKLVLSREKPPVPAPPPPAAVSNAPPLAAPAAFTNTVPLVAPAAPKVAPRAAPAANAAVAADAATNGCPWSGALQFYWPLDDTWSHGVGAEARYAWPWKPNWEWAATFGIGQWSANQSKNALVPATLVYQAGFRGSATVIAPGVALTRLFPQDARTTYFLEGALRYEFIQSAVDIEFDYVAHHGENMKVRSPFEPKGRPSGFLGAGVIHQFPPSYTAFAEIGYQADLSQSETTWLENSIPCTFDAVVLAAGLHF